MDTVDLIIKSSMEFYNDLKADENGRYRSWEHCYSHFIKARESKEVDYDYLSLQLAFYLASWGMYRGSPAQSTSICSPGFLGIRMVALRFSSSFWM